MKKVAATVALTFALGAAAMAVLGGVVGGAAEAMSVGLVGAGLVGTSYALGGKLSHKSSAQSARQMRESGAA